MTARAAPTARVRGLLHPGAALLAVLLVCAPLSACAPQHERPLRGSPSPLPSGSIVPIPAPPTSYAGLGAFGRYAEALDRQYGVEPDFGDWNQVADDSCSYLANGDPATMGEPTSLVSTRDHEAIEPDGGLIHPLAGKVWAAAVLTRCPELLTADVRNRIEVEQTRGLAWARSLR